MRRLIPLLIVLGITGPPALAASFYFCPDVPTDRAGTTYMPWNIVRNDSGAYSLALALPGSTATDSLHRMCSGDWLFSVEAAAELPPGGGVFHEPRDVVRYDPALVVYSSFFCGALVGIPTGSDVDAAFLDGGDAADLILSFDVPTDLTAIGGGIYEPADLVRFKHTGAGCGGWIPVGLYFDASTAVPAVRLTSNVTGADRRIGRTVLTFDVPTTLGAPTFFPGQMVSWNGLTFTSFYLDGTWPLSSRVDAFSFLPDPGSVPTMHVDKSALTPGDLAITWTASLSVGAEDYGIYEGSITSPWVYNHGSFPYVKVCHDAGFDFTEEITPTAGNVYYLVVALNPDLEGSYGQNSTGERPPSGSPCRPAQGFDCP
jgi:hypothetical protein